MPVRKYRSIEDMNRDWRWDRPGDPVITQKIRGLWEFAERAVQPVGLCVPRGVRKYHSLEEANADRDRWERERIARLREYHEANKS